MKNSLKRMGIVAALVGGSYTGNLDTYAQETQKDNINQSSNNTGLEKKVKDSSKNQNSDKQTYKNQNEYEAVLKGRDFLELSETKQKMALGELEDTNWRYISKNKDSYKYRVRDWDAKKQKWFYTEKYVPGHSKETEEKRWKNSSKKGLIREAQEHQMIDFGVKAVLHFILGATDASNDKKK